MMPEVASRPPIETAKTKIGNQLGFARPVFQHDDQPHDADGPPGADQPPAGFDQLFPEFDTRLHCVEMRMQRRANQAAHQIGQNNENANGPADPEPDRP
jgi:hypothetical protein